MSGVILSLALLAASPAEPEPAATLQAAIAAHKQGRVLAGELKSDAAIAKLEEALASYARALSVMPSITPIADCLIDIGSVWLDRGKEDRASAAFRRAVTIAPAMSIDTNRYNPAVAALFAKTKREMARLAALPLTIVAEPAGASVRLDDTMVGATPISLAAVAPGEHWLVVSMPGYHAFAAPVTVDRSHAKIDIFLRSAGTLVAPPADAPRAPPVEAPHASIVVPAPVPRVHPALAILPLGIGEFAEHRPLPASAFLAAEILLLGANIATGIVIRNDKLPNGAYGNGARDRALQVVNLTAFGVLLATVIGNGVDGLMHRDLP